MKVRAANIEFCVWWRVLQFCVVLGDESEVGNCIVPNQSMQLLFRKCQHLIHLNLLIGPEIDILNTLMSPNISEHWKFCFMQAGLSVGSQFALLDLFRVFRMTDSGS